MFITKGADCTHYFVLISVTISFLASNSDMQICKENCKKFQSFVLFLTYMQSLVLCCLCFLDLIAFLSVCTSVPFMDSLSLIITFFLVLSDIANDHDSYQFKLSWNEIVKCELLFQGCRVDRCNRAA